VSRRAAADESKLSRLRRYLTRINQPAIVFTEYRDTLARLQRILQGHSLPVLALHGGMPDAERRGVVQAFNARDSVLLATDAAAEGLNLHQRCRLVVHFELPWNPLRLEQRTGRVDRIGQTRRVHEVALVADDTAERAVLAPLARRARKAMEVMPGGGRMLELLAEMRVAEAVITGRADTLAVVPGARFACRQLHLSDEAAAEATRLEQERQWLSSDAGTLGANDYRPLVATFTRKQRREDPRLTLVYTLSLETADGRTTHAEPLILCVRRPTHARPAARATDAVRVVHEELEARQAAIQRCIAARVAALRSTVAPAHERLLAALSAREAAIGELLTQPAPQLVQAGLFDRRAVREAEARAAVERLRRHEAEQHVAQLRAADVLSVRTTLDAALVHEGDLS